MTVTHTDADQLFSLEGRTAVVTGGTSGIGLMIAGGFVDAGARVIVTSRKADAVQAAVESLGERGEVEGTTSNLSTEEGCREFADWMAERHDSLDVLVNNAGATWGVPLEEHDEASWSKVLDLNVKGVFHTTKFLLPLLRSAGTADEPARVINIGSINGIEPPILETYSYSASKAAVHMLTRHLAAQLAPQITVNAVAPGAFPSKMMRETLETFGEQIAASTPLKRVGRPDDMAGVTRFLASRAGAFLTGAVIPVDGGASTCG
ncbi:MAG: SDR family NAD(P)-dependent oxidoreductase [Microthrixaceae bacterium]